VTHLCKVGTLAITWLCAKHLKQKEIVVTELRRFRGAMAPTAAEVEGEPTVASTDTLSAILGKVRALRQMLNKRG
jgi:hypothetical protein